MPKYRVTRGRSLVVTADSTLSAVEEFCKQTGTEQSGIPETLQIEPIGDPDSKAVGEELARPIPKNNATRSAKPTPPTADIKKGEVSKKPK